MATEVLMPKLGLTMTEGTIFEWKVKEGQPVKKGEVLFSVETDKLTSDVESETDGVLLKILTPEGDTSECKSIVAWIGSNNETIPDTRFSRTAELITSKSDSKNSDHSKEVVSYTADASTRATPYAKKLARAKGYNIASIVGSGPKGTIVSMDVEKYALILEATPKSFVDKSTSVVDKVDFLTAKGEGNDLPPVKVSSLRRSIATNMSISWSTSPRVTYTYPVDVSAMKELRAKLKDGLNEQGIKLSYNHILMKVVAKALVEFPDINASFQDNMLIHHKHVNLGLAVAKGDGLFVPNVKHAETKTLPEIAKEMESLIEDTRNGNLSSDDMTGGTFTISNLGRSGITYFSPIINQPELAILGVCDMVETPVVRDGQITIRSLMNLCLSADHRVVDGMLASKFLSRIGELLENPYLLI